MDENELNSMMQDENASLKFKIAEAIKEQEQLKKQVGELRQQLAASQASFSSNQENDQAKIKALEVDFTRVMEQLSIKQAEIDDLNDLIEIKDGDFAQIQAEVDQYVVDLQNKQAEIDMINLEMDQRVNTSEQVTALQGKIALLEQEVMMLKME